MSALDKESILVAIRSRKLVISPIISNDQIGSCSIDLRMGTVALLSRAGSKSHIDPAERVKTSNSHDSMRIRQQKHERFDIPFEHYFLLHPGSLILVPTLEWVKLPGDLQGVVTARSSWAREGLSIATATLINPHYCGIITLELANLGQIPIKLYPGLRLAQIAFYKLTNETAPPNDPQFNLSFEPVAGDVAKGDTVFLPKSETP